LSAVVGERDKALRATVPRNINPTMGKYLQLDADPIAVHLDADGVTTTPVITFTAKTVGFEATVLWSITSGGTLNGSGKNVRTMDASSMTAASVRVIATVTYEGQAYIATKTIFKVTDGKAGTDADPADLSPEALVAALEGRITKSELYADLRTTIDLIDGPDSVATTIPGQIKKETDARIAAITKEASDRVTYVQQYTYSEQEIDNSLSVLAATITAQYKAYADGVGGAAVSNSTAYIQTYAYSKATSDSALAAMADTLRSEFATNSGVSVAYLNNYAFSKAETNSAIASATQTLSTTVGGHTTTLQTQATSIDGLSGQMTFKIDNNNHITGFGLASTPINGVPYGIAIFNVDALSVVAPGVAAKPMFTVGQVGGQTQMVLRGDMYADGGIKASSLAIGNADNVLPDSNMLDSVYWGRAEEYFSSPAPGGFWTSTRIFSIGAGHAYSDTSTPFFPVARGGIYLFELQVFMTDDYAGPCAIYAHLPGQEWLQLGIESRGYTFAQAGIPGGADNIVTFDENSVKGTRVGKATRTINGNVDRVQFRIITNVTRGTIQFGGVRVTRVVDQTLIGPGVIETKHMTIANGGHIASGQTDFDVGNGWWLEGALPGGHGARLSIGDSLGRRLICDPQNNIMKIVNFEDGTPQFQATISNSIGQNYFTGPKSGFTFGVFNLSVANGVGPYSISWSVDNVNAPTSQAIITSGVHDTQSVVKGTCQVTGEFDFQLSATVIDSRGKAASALFLMVGNFT